MIERSFANSHKVRRALQQLEFFVCADLFTTETAQLADIVLPAPAATGEDGGLHSTSSLACERPPRNPPRRLGREVY